jgi:hypothetical protein
MRQPAVAFSRNREILKGLGPVTVLQLVRLLPFLFGGHRQLALENVALRHQMTAYLAGAVSDNSVTIGDNQGLSGEKPSAEVLAVGR